MAVYEADIEELNALLGESWTQCKRWEKALACLTDAEKKQIDFPRGKEGEDWFYEIAGAIHVDPAPLDAIHKDIQEKAKEMRETYPSLFTHAEGLFVWYVHHRSLYGAEGRRILEKMKILTLAKKGETDEREKEPVYEDKEQERWMILEINFQTVQHRLEEKNFSKRQIKSVWNFFDKTYGLNQIKPLEEEVLRKIAEIRYNAAFIQEMHCSKKTEWAEEEKRRKAFLEEETTPEKVEALRHVTKAYAEGVKEKLPFVQSDRQEMVLLFLKEKYDMIGRVMMAMALEGKRERLVKEEENICSCRFVGSFGETAKLTVPQTYACWQALWEVGHTVEKEDFFPQ